MCATVVHRRRKPEPLPIRDGLNPTRAVVPAHWAGRTARDFIAYLIDTQRHRSPEDDAAALEARFLDGEVVNHLGQPFSPHTLLAEKDTLWFYRIPLDEPPAPGEITIVFEDENILVIDKPPFLATMPRGRHVIETATVRVRRTTGNDELSPAHRLDRLTAGLLLFTKRREVRGAYQELFARREVDKTYHAVAAFNPELQERTPITWQDRIQKRPGELQAWFAEGEINAITELHSVTPLDAPTTEQLNRIHSTTGDLGLYRLHPLTGKTHQLRMHMWKAGVPILGDAVYPTVLPIDEEDLSRPLRLVASELKFQDPLNAQTRHFRSQRLVAAN